MLGSLWQMVVQSKSFTLDDLSPNLKTWSYYGDKKKGMYSNRSLKRVHTTIGRKTWAIYS